MTDIAKKQVIQLRVQLMNHVKKVVQEEERIAKEEDGEGSRKDKDVDVKEKYTINIK